MQTNCTRCGKGFKACFVFQVAVVAGARQY